MQFKYIFGAAAAAVAVKAQEANSTNLTSLLAGNSELSALNTLLSAYPDVAGALANATNITIFAPSNIALQSANESGALSTLSAVGGAVQALLQYHVLGSIIYASGISKTPAFAPTLLANETYTNVTGGQVVEARVVDGGVSIISGLKNNVSVTTPNLNFTGGVVHIIDGLLTIPPGVGEALTAANLTALLGAVEATNLTSALSTTPDITIFAPNNAAFQAIGSAVANLTVEQAAAILEYHVINGTVAYSSTLTNGSVPALGGGNLTITVTDGEVFVNQARVINADILLANGVLHVIDSVLKINDTTAGNSTQTEPANPYSASAGTEVPYTSGVASATTTIAALVTSNSAVASGYVGPTGAVGVNSAGNPSASASASSSAGAAAVTAGVGAAALFGGAAFIAGW
nr:hypothetical protein B0A51_12025 [Rachicladosporium sp. CCFEE 5018]